MIKTGNDFFNLNNNLVPDLGDNTSELIGDIIIVYIE